MKQDTKEEKSAKIIAEQMLLVHRDIVDVFKKQKVPKMLIPYYLDMLKADFQVQMIIPDGKHEVYIK